MLYFAYGSNMDWPQMRERCPSARFVCVAELKDHAIGFTRRSPRRKGSVADVVPTPGHSVWGVAYHIDDADIARLDKSEGYRPGRRREENSYLREERHVLRDSDQESPLAVQVYFAIPEADPPLPSRNYLQLIVGGARYWHLPDDYIASLEAQECAR